MITVDDIVSDGDMVAPEPWIIERSQGTWVSGGYQSITTNIEVIGPVRVASNKEIMMLPEGDRVGSLRCFYATQVMYVTRGHVSAAVPQGGLLVGVGTTFTLPVVIAGGVADIFLNGLMLTPDVDYILVGTTLTLFTAITDTDMLVYSVLVTRKVDSAASDIIEFDGHRYRVLSVYYTPGSAYWKATATRMAAT